MKRQYPILGFALAALLLAGCAVYGDFVWLDQNGDGIQDAGEPGVEGVQVSLHNTVGVTYSYAITNADGRYQIARNPFRNTRDYYLEFMPPAGFEFTLQDQGGDDLLDSDVNPSTGQTAIITGGVTGVGFDAGLVEEGQAAENLVPEDSSPVFAPISGYVWVDADHDGRQDEDELPLAEVDVNLFLVDADNPSQQTVTGPEGLYQFDEVEAGLDYYIRFVPPAEYAMTLMDQGDDDEVDSDADEETDETAIFTLTEAGAIMDAGVYIPIAASICYGPTAEDFPEDISPLSGLPVGDPTYLAYRPLFLSISIFPASVRPPTIGVSPLIYEIYIGDGETRLMTAFYGEFPQVNFDAAGEATGAESGQPEGDLVVGDRVWFDTNANGLQDEGEAGVPNIPVTLYINGGTFAQTLTDDFGFYYFDYSEVDPDSNIQIFFDIFSVHPDFYFVTRDVGDDDEIDSDVGSLGYSYIFNLADGLLADIDLSVDAGVRQSVPIEGLRSGRVAYQDVQGHYCGCLVTAGADPTVAAQINTCASAFGDAGDIGSAGLDVTRLQAIAEQSSEEACGGADLAANLFCTSTPEDGAQAMELWVEYSYFNINHFIYDGEGAYNWYINGTSEATQQEFTLMTDGINGEPLTFENVVVMQIDHAQENADGTIFTLDLDFTSGIAYYFRNGQMYEGTWTTLAGAGYDPNSEMLPQTRFLDANGEPFAFAPGQTWVNTVNTGDNLRPGEGAGMWEVDFDAPAYNP